MDLKECLFWGLTWENVIYVSPFLEYSMNFGAANEIYVHHMIDDRSEQGMPS